MEPRLDPERRLEEARESLVTHLGELGRRFKVVRARLDVRAQISARPLAAVGAAFALGALLGLPGGRKRQGGEAKGSLAGAAFGVVGAIAIRLVKELAMRGATTAARGWIERKYGAVLPSEVRTSYDRNMEPFLRR